MCSSGRAGLALAALVAAINLGTYLVPVLASGGGVRMALGRVAREHLPEGSLLIVAGHELFGDVTGPSAYFHRIDVFNVTYDVIDKGAAGYEKRLRSLIEHTFARGARLAVLSDLVGRPTPGGIGLSEREHPVPSLDDLGRLLAPFPQGESWTVDRYTFVTLLPAARGADPEPAD
jgi:hypothetical protein